MKKINLTNEQLELLVEILSGAEIEANASCQMRHVLFLPDLFKKLSDYQLSIASLKEAFKIILNDNQNEKISNIR